MAADKEYHPDITMCALTETELSLNPFLALITENNSNLVQLANCALLGYYAAINGNFLLTFRDNLSIQSPWIKILEPRGWDR